MNPRIIFCPRTDKLQKQTTIHFYEQRKMTDHGDHIEWTDGRKIWKWRLPDQKGASEYPVLKHILFVPAKSVLNLPVKLFRVAFISEDGSILAYLSQSNPILPKDILDRILPEEAYAELKSHGVTRTTEEYPSVKALHAAHPEPSLHPLARSFTDHPGLWAVGFFVSMIAGAFIYSVAAGYFSSGY